MDDTTRAKFDTVVTAHLDVQRALWAICEQLAVDDPDQDFEKVETQAISAMDRLRAAMDAVSDVWYLTYTAEAVNPFTGEVYLTGPDSDEPLDNDGLDALKAEVAIDLQHIAETNSATRERIPALAALTKDEDIEQIYAFAAIFGENADDIEQWLLGA